MSDIRSHIIIGAIEPVTEGGRLWHKEWHDGESFYGAPTECGTAGCGFLGRILSVEAEAAALVHVHDGEWCAKCVEHGVVEEVRRNMTKDEAPAVAVREVLDKTLRAYGVDSVGNQVIHGWRCREKVMFPEPCGHYEELLDELVAEVMKTR